MHDPASFDAAPAAASRYTPSGWFNPFAMVLALTVAAAVALGMAYVLYLAQENFYFYFVTPLLVGAPVFFAIWWAIRFSQCRNTMLGTLVGLAIGALYYVGFWEISYQRNVVAQGRGAVKMMEIMGGAPGLPGYFAFIAKNSQPVAAHGAPAAPNRPPTKADEVFNYVLFGGEAIMVLAIGVGIARAGSQRVYYEEKRRWSSSFEFRLPPTALDTARAAIESSDWDALAALPRISSAGGANQKSLLFRVEYLAGASDEPFYVTLRGGSPMKGQLDTVLPAGKKAFDIVQRPIPPESGRALAEHFPDLKAKLGEADKASAAVDDPFAEKPAKKRFSFGAKKAPAGDFREKAVEASLALLGEDGDDPRMIDASWCLPAGGDRRAIRREAWWKYKPLLLTVALFFGGLGVAAWAEGQNKGAPNPNPAWRALMWVGGTVAVSGAVLMLFSLFGGDWIHKFALARRLGRRPGSLLEVAGGLPRRVLRVEDAKTFHVGKVMPEDVVLCLFDRPNRRLLLEGVSHRYVIRSDDVTTVWPLQSGQYISVQLAYRIGKEPLALVFSADNPMFHLFHGAFHERPLKSLVKKLVGTFDREFPEAGKPPRAKA